MHSKKRFHSSLRGPLIKITYIRAKTRLRGAELQGVLGRISKVLSTKEAMAMQAQASALPARDGIPRSSLWGCRLASSTSSELCPWINVSRKPIPVRMAISRKTKEETVEKIKQELEGCTLMASIRYTGLTVKQMQELRKVLPETTKLIVAKNRLVNKAVQGTEWEAIAPALKGMNAWLFVHTEEIPAALKPYRTFQKEAKVDTNDFSGGVFEGKFYPPEEFKSLETMPTRAEIFSKLLGSLKAPSSSVVSVLQGPSRNLVMTLKAYVQKLEEQQSGSAS